jgi:hypothetical protein
MPVLQALPTITGETFSYTRVLRQNPPAPISFTAAANTQAIPLFGLPAKHIVTGVRFQLVTPFVAFGMSSCQITLGTTGSANYYAPAYECKQLVSGTTGIPFMYWSPFAMYTLAAHDIIATVTSVGAQLSAITAGEINIMIFYRSL